MGKACCRAPLFLCSLQPTSPQWVRKGLVLHREEVTPPRGGLFPACEHSSGRCLALCGHVFSALVSWQSSLCCRDSGSGRPGRLGWVVWKWASESPSSDAALPDTWCCFRVFPHHPVELCPGQCSADVCVIRFSVLVC